MSRVWGVAGVGVWLLAAGYAGAGVQRRQVERGSRPVAPKRGWDLWPVVSAAVPFNEGSGGSRRSQFNFVADVVGTCAPSVAYIELKDARRRDSYGQAATVSNGSGFVVREDGLLLTNAHVVLSSPRSTLLVRLHDGRVFNGKVEDVDVNSDLATIRIQAKGLPTMKLGESSDIKPGEWVIALGSPLSLSNTVTAGVVSSIARASEELGLTGKKDMSYIQTDAAITFGNSGGPLVNLDGEAIGINSMKVASGISFAIPIDYAKDFLSRRSGKSTFSKKYIGVTMLSLNPDIIKMLKEKDMSTVMHGVLIWKVIIGSPADESGVKPGDVITHINEKPINTANDVYKLLEEDLPYLTLRIVRYHNTFEIKVRPDMY